MEGKQLLLFTTTVVCLVISTIVVTSRAIVRFAIRGFGLDDWLVAGSQIFFIGTCIAVMFGCKSGLGVKDAWLTTNERIGARHAVINFECLYLTSLILVKSSICCALLRITTSKVIRILLYIEVFLSFCCGFITIVAVLAICKPVSATWTGQGTCDSAGVLVGVAYYVTVSSVITDLCCSILPFFILWDLHLDRKTKMTLVGILSLGFLASIATIVRAFYLKRFTATTDYAWGYADLAIWSIIENCIALTVASLPSLKPLLRRIGIFTSAVRSKKSSSRENGDAESSYGSKRRGYALSTINSSSCDNDVVSFTHAGTVEGSESIKNILRDDVVVISSEVDLEEEYV